MFEEKISEMINDIFIEEQNKRGIQYGDCDLWLTLKLDEKIAEISKIMEEILQYQEN